MRLYQEQLALLEDGSFVKSLASAVARMGNVASLLINDQMVAKRYHSLHWLDTTYNPLPPREPRPDVLPRFLSAPLNWRAIANEAKAPTDLPTARLLWELPIALHQADTPLRELQINIIPRHGYFSILSPGAYYPPDRAAATWAALADACEHLEAFVFRPGIHYQQTAEDDKTYLDAYLTAVLGRCAPRRLRHLDLDFFQACMNYVESPGDETRRHFYPAADLVAGLVALPRVKSLRLRGVELREGELDRVVCGG